MNHLARFAKLYNIAFLRRYGKPLSRAVYLVREANWRCLERPKGATSVGGRATVLALVGTLGLPAEEPQHPGTILELLIEGSHTIWRMKLRPAEDN